MSSGNSYEEEIAYMEQRRREALREQESADEELARLLEEEDRVAVQQHQERPAELVRQSSLPRPSQYLGDGQAALVKFSHVSSGSQLGEVVLARSTGPSLMTFEVTASPGRFLSVNNDGVVEFSAVRNDRISFHVRVLADGSIALLCVAHQRKPNRAGGIGWFLALTAGRT